MVQNTGYRLTSINTSADKATAETTPTTKVITSPVNVSRAIFEDGFCFFIRVTFYYILFFVFFVYVLGDFVSTANLSFPGSAGNPLVADARVCTTAEPALTAAAVCPACSGR